MCCICAEHCVQSDLISADFFRIFVSLAIDGGGGDAAAGDGIKNDAIDLNMDAQSDDEVRTFISTSGKVESISEHRDMADIVLIGFGCATACALVALIMSFVANE